MSDEQEAGLESLANKYVMYSGWFTGPL
jgi:hypothetical protein